MHIKQALAAYRHQKSNAARRGVEFLLTFKEWCDWWGDDIDRRGSGHDQLQMQRIADTGPYALGNIRKGYPRDNSRTMGKMRRKRLTEEAARVLEEARDTSSAVACDIEDEPTDDEKFYARLGSYGSPMRFFGKYQADR